MVDGLFFLAVGALGWGLSLATYRAVARWNGWPLGTAQTTVPALTMTLGILSAATGLAFALARGPMHGGIVILVFGVALAVFWSGFLRVGAQSALFLAPLSAAALIIAWLARALGF
ncbi:MAG: hypothetical protein Q8L61_01840 [Hyphomicrobium sp.]|nr:hypothetical protein [Hyphomicrobium sp.]